MNPYWGKDFFQFIGLFVERLFLLLTGKLSLEQITPDEIQIGVLILMALSSALIGTFLVLRKMTMLANSLSHTILLGIVLAYLIVFPQLSTENFSFELSLGALFLAALLTGILTTVLTQFFTYFIKLQEDASIGLVFTTLFAIGIILVTVFTRNLHLGTEAIMGNVDALHIHDLKVVFFVMVIDFGIVALFFKELQLTTFDPSLAASLRISPQKYSLLLMMLTAFTAIASFRAVGALLFLAFLVGPVLIARLLTHRFSLVIFYACLIGAFCSFCSVALSRHLLSVYELALSTSGIVVTMIGILYALFLGCFRFRKRNSQVA